MQVRDAAHMLADRLNSVGLGEFRANERGEVIGPSAGFHVPITPVDAGRGRPYEVEQALGRARDTECAVVVADELGPRALELLTASQANYMDRRRLYVRLRAPEFLVSIVDEDEMYPLSVQESALELDGAVGAVVIAILDEQRKRASEEPGAQGGPAFRVTEVAKAAHVAPATAQRVFFGLEAEGLLRSEGKGPQKVRRLTDPSRLLDRYAADAGRDRRKAIRLRVLGDSTMEIARYVADSLKAADVGYCLTGSAAAALDAPTLTSVPLIEMWVNGPRAQFGARSIGNAIASEEGANLLLWPAGTRGPWAGGRYDGSTGFQFKVASWFRVYADLLANPQRGREQAISYREQVIGF
jgi:hypothetical protein